MISTNIENSDKTTVSYYRKDAKAIELTELIKTKFNIIDTSNWDSISAPSYNSIVDDLVVTALLKSPTTYLDHLDPITSSRKYLLNKMHIYEKVYAFLTNKTCEFELPAESNALAKGYLVNIYGQPGDQDYSHYIDIYFSCKDHKAVETWANKEFIVGKYSNYYCATFDSVTKERLKVKNYWYDEQQSLSDWDEYWVVQCKKRGLDPLTELS